jgi:transposase
MRNGNTEKPKRVKRVSERALLVAVDIAKVKHVGYWRCPDGTESKPFSFFNTGQGFQRFWEIVCGARKTFVLEEVIVGFESTGVYAEPLLHFLRKRGVRMVQVNPLHAKRLRELSGNSPNKTDEKDPKVIADIMELGHALTVIVPEGAAAELRRLTNARERGLQRRTALLNQLQDLVFIIFPEFLEVMKGVKSRSAQYLLANYPTPERMIQRGLEELAQDLKKVSRGKLGRGRAQSLYGAALSSVGIREGQKSIVLEILENLSSIEAIERFIGKVEKEMTGHLKEIPYSRWILSIKGIGLVTAAGLIGEIGDFGQFRTVSEILKLAGMDLFEISSGKHKGNRRISKRGRALLRKLLFYAALNTVRKGGAMQQDYRRYLERGMPGKKALIVIARKLLRIIFALVRDHKAFVQGGFATHYQFKEAA